MQATASFPDDFPASTEAAETGGTTPADDPEVAIMLRVAAGAEDAFAELVRRHQNPLLNFFTRMGACSDGEDLVQETFVRLYRYREKYQPSARFSTFLYHLARNVWADRGRKLMRFDRLANALRVQAERRQAGPISSPGAGLDVEAALASLSPKLREAVVLNIYQGLRYQEVADVLGIPLGTVKSRINLAMAELRNFLNED